MGQVLGPDGKPLRKRAKEFNFNEDFQSALARIKAVEHEVDGLRISTRPDLALFEEAERHRKFLHLSMRWSIACILALVVVATGAAGWILGDRLDAAAHGVIHEKKVSIRINKKIDEALLSIPDIAKKSIEAQVPPLVLKEIEAALLSGAEATIETVVSKKLEVLDSLNGDDVKALLLSIVPIGTVVAWPGSLPPENDPWHTRWHECDGTAIDASQTDPIYLALRQTYGMAPTGKVKLPNFRGMFLRGLGGNSFNLGQPQGDELKEHAHRMFSGTKSSVNSNTPSANDPVSHEGARTGNDAYTVLKPDGETKAFYGRTDVEGGSETRPENYAVRWVIRVK